MEIKEQLDELFNLEQQLHTYLDEKQFEFFQQQQDLFTAKVKQLLDLNSPEVLNTVINELKTLQSKLDKLQIRSEQSCKELKEKSLLQKRSKNKIKAYSTK